MTYSDTTDTTHDPKGDTVTVQIPTADWAKILECAHRDSRTPARILHVAITRYHGGRKL